MPDSSLEPQQLEPAAQGRLTLALVAEREAFVALCETDDNTGVAPTFLGFDRDQWLTAGNPAGPTIHEALPHLCGMSDIVARWRREETTKMLEDDRDVPKYWGTGGTIIRWEQDHAEVVAGRNAREGERARRHAEQDAEIGRISDARTA
jgi:hypothetical protein